eukprot:1161495-Pelagomonas_calceolata.AAC.1
MAVACSTPNAVALHAAFHTQVVLVDGCGLLHPQRCGSACHLGVVRSIPTIGVSKNVFAIGGLDRSAIEEAFEAAQQQPQNQGCPATVPLRKGKDRVAFPLKDCGSSPEEDAFEAAQQQPLIQGCSAADPLTTLGSSPAEAAVANAQQQPHDQGCPAAVPFRLLGSNPEEAAFEAAQQQPRDQGCPAAVPFRLLGSNPEEAAFEAAQQQPHDQGCSAAATLESSVSGPFQAGVVTIQQQPLNQGCCPATVPVSSSSSDSLEARANATPPQQPRNQGCCPATVPVTSSSSSPSEAKDGATPQQHLPPPDALLQSHRQQYHHNHGHPKRHHHSHDPKRHHHNNFRQHHPQQHKAHLQKASIVVSRARVQEALACSQGPSLRVEALPSGHWLCSLKDAASSELLGAALCGPSTKKPIYVSVGEADLLADVSLRDETGWGGQGAQVQGGPEVPLQCTSRSMHLGKRLTAGSSSGAHKGSTKQAGIRSFGNETSECASSVGHSLQKQKAFGGLTDCYPTHTQMSPHAALRAQCQLDNVRNAPTNIANV